MKLNKITIYTDGAARGNPGPSGWGVKMIIGDKVKEIGGYGGGKGTNNQMELKAPIEALKFLSARKDLAEGEIEIYSDSKYVITGINEWIHNWLKNDWKTATRKPVLNKELWQELHALNQKIKPKWHYVAGHSEHKENNRVDEIATCFADKIKIELKNDF